MCWSQIIPIGFPDPTSRVAEENWMRKKWVTFIDHMFREPFKGISPKYHMGSVLWSYCLNSTILLMHHTQAMHKIATVHIACWVPSFRLIQDSSVGLWVGIQSAVDYVSWDFQVRILHSAEEDNWPPLDSNIACLWLSIEINNNKHVCRQNQVRKPNGSEVKWAVPVPVISLV